MSLASSVPEISWLSETESQTDRTTDNTTELNVASYAYTGEQSHKKEMSKDNCLSDSSRVSSHHVLVENSDKQTDRQTHRQQTDRQQTDRQTDNRQTYVNLHRHRKGPVELSQ